MADIENNEGYKVEAFEAFEKEDSYGWKRIYNRFFDTEEEATKVAKEIAERISDVYGKNYTVVYDCDGMEIDSFTGPYNTSISPDISHLEKLGRPAK